MIFDPLNSSETEMLLVQMISFQTLIWAATRTRRQKLEGFHRRDSAALTCGGGRTPCATEATHQGAACAFTSTGLKSCSTEGSR